MVIRAALVTAVVALIASCGESEREIAEHRLYFAEREMADCFAQFIGDMEGLDAEVVPVRKPGWSVRVTGDADVVEDFGQREFTVSCIKSLG